VRLDDKATAGKLVKLLEYNRPEVFVVAAWALRKLAVADTLPDQLRAIERRWQVWGKRGPNPIRDALDAQLAQLCESMGQAKYAAAAPVLAKFIPKIVLKIFGAKSRIAAIWALGIIDEKQPPANIVAQMVERLEDDQTLDPEDLGVRQSCAISLGRMRAKEAIDGLRVNYPMRLSTSAFVCACAWAMERITGQKQEIAPVERIYYLGWFLEPNR
jgi:HEAT repeat protein